MLSTRNILNEMFLLVIDDFFILACIVPPVIDYRMNVCSLPLFKPYKCKYNTIVKVSNFRLNKADKMQSAFNEALKKF